MKKVLSLSVAAIMLTALYCMPAFAKAEASPHSIYGMAAIGTDYISEGNSGTMNEPAIQIDLGYAYSINGGASEIYTGVWGVNYDDDWTESSLELWFYVGYWTEIGPIELTLEAAYDHYPGSQDSGIPDVDPDETYEWVDGEAETDYFEFHIGLAHAFDLPLFPYLSVGFDYAPEYWGEDGVSYAFTTKLDLSLPYEFKLAFGGGYRDVEGDKQSGKYFDGVAWDGLDEKEGYSWAYYSVGLSREIMGANLDLTYHFGNSEKDYFGSVADDKVVFTVSYSF